MRFILLTLFILAAGSALCAQAQANAEPQAGVPRELARWRAAHYSDVRYSLSIELASGATVLKGMETIQLSLDDAAKEIILDWRVLPLKDGQERPRVWDIQLNGRPVKDAREVNEHIIIPGAHRGENILSLRFESTIATSGSAVMRYLDREDNSEYIYTLFVPSDASTAFPCFDQPDLKARFTLDLDVPDNWTAVSNTETTTRPSDRSSAVEGRKTFSFLETKPLSTYLFAFAAGPFVELKDDSAAIPIRLFARRSKADRARTEAAEVFRLNRECLAYLAKYFDFKFPFPKYDLVILPEFAYRGMEHAGATFLREESIFFPTGPTANDFLSRANVIFHEAAHQWFGDLVTMRWFDDLWLKEGFAEFMSFKALATVMPEFNAWKAFYERTKPAAYLTDATKGTTPIFQEIPNLSAAKSAYGNIVYRKAPSMLRQAEVYLGPDEFQRAIQLFLKEHAYANALWSDLVRDFEKTTGRKLGLWADAWVRRRGMPEVHVAWNRRANGSVKSISVTQTDALGEGGVWPMRLNLLLVFEDGTRQTRAVTLGANGRPQVIAIDAKTARAHPLVYVFANFQDYGYGLFPLDEESRSYVLSHLGDERDDFLRALLWGSLWDSVRAAELAPADYIELAIRNIAGEKDEVTLQAILNRVNTAFNAYLSGTQRTAMATRLERMLLDRVMKADTVGQRITYLRAFQAIATTESGRGVLKKILSGELKVPDVVLRSRDRFDIITSLLAHADADADALLTAQAEADKSDDARRYAYAAGAARASRENKRKYFDAYLSDATLAESWIEASVGPFNTIHQSALTLAYLKPALEALPQLKRTRKIFFVNGWLAAFIGGQCGDDALSIVHDFLAREKTLDRDLRLKVLEAVDGLERCVRIRTKYAGEKVQRKRPAIRVDDAD